MAKRARQRPTQPQRKASRSKAMPARGRAVGSQDVLRADRRPGTEALVLFEKAVQALQRHDYRAASAFFEELVAAHPAEAALCERSLVYLALCRRELARRPVDPRTIEERLTAATAALNNGDDDTAEVFVTSVLRESPQHDLALYLLAAVEARRGATDEALLLLSRAMTVNPEIRAQAKHEADFDVIRDLEAFRRLMDSPVGGGPDDPRRTRRVRGDR